MRCPRIEGKKNIVKKIDLRWRRRVAVWRIRG
jgi:hypothetical protein